MKRRDGAPSRETYAESVRKYLSFTAEQVLQASLIRLEAHVESWRDWSVLHSLPEIEAWFIEARRNCQMTITDIPLNQTKGWNIAPDTGNVSHKSGDFFTIHGIRVQATADREVGVVGWDQPILTQVGYDGGILGILRKRFDGIPHYLIEAKAEPGNYGVVLLSPTLQATFANLRRCHGARRPRFAELFEEPERNGAEVLYRQWLSEDGGRLHKKRNLGILIEVPEETEVETPRGFVWMSLWQLKEILATQNAWVNPHIRGVIAHL